MAKGKLTFDKHLDVKLVSRKKGYYRVKLNLRPFLLNHGGIAHGGVLATVCDIALAGAVETVINKDTWCITAQLNIEFINPAFPDEPIFGYGKLVKIGKTLAFVSGGIETKSKKQIAKASGIWVIKTGSTRRIKTTKKLE